MVKYRRQSGRGVGRQHVPQRTYLGIKLGNNRLNFAQGIARRINLGHAFAFLFLGCINRYPSSFHPCACAFDRLIGCRDFHRRHRAIPELLVLAIQPFKLLLQTVITLDGHPHLTL